MITKVIAALGTLLATAVFATAASAQTLSPNSDPAASLYAGVRYQNFSSSLIAPAEDGLVQVFPSPYDGVTYTASMASWQLSTGISSPVVITYDGGVLSTEAAGITTTRPVGSLGVLNYILLRVTRAEFANTTLGNTSIALDAIDLNGVLLGSAGVGGVVSTGLWKITGATLTSGFTLTGQLNVDGDLSELDAAFVQVEVGYLPPADGQGPVTSSVETQPLPALLNGAVTVTAHVSDDTTGSNGIASAQYSLDDGVTWQAMSAQDGSFDSPNEDVQASFYATAVGTHNVCVRGIDSLGNTGGTACQPYGVAYKVDGFFQPIDNPPAVNSAKAGQAIPVKWRLTDANGVPIDNPASFVDLQTSRVDCDDFAGDRLFGVEEVASGASGLQYMGDGYWQFNWKTPTTIRGHVPHDGGPAQRRWAVAAGQVQVPQVTCTRGGGWPPLSTGVRAVGAGRHPHAPMCPHATHMHARASSAPARRG